ncbi:hypothetical protein KQX54_017018 [Cotesia glomerata]|uniref:Uncharacterized protein n=1 Tax=Cotesia glomerata TaxID=32391 RepID=A0AAV7IRJ6_COTGL|nr:hypothetical protein KQX54_017018 [Cotesia glomerata]
MNLSDERIGFIANIKTRYDDDDNDNKLNEKIQVEKQKKKSEEEKALLAKEVLYLHRVEKYTFQVLPDYQNQKTQEEVMIFSAKELSLL